MSEPKPCRSDCAKRKILGFDVDELASLITDRTRLIILNSPHNPTGGVLSKRDIHDIASAIGDRNIMVLSDEIYSRLIFDGEHHSIMSVPGFQERTILLDGFSKTYAMTGWRMGYGVMRPDLATHITRLMTNSNSCTASFTQMAGIEAIRGDQSSVEQMRTEFQRRRDAFVAGLNRIKGFSCRIPKERSTCSQTSRRPGGSQEARRRVCWTRRALPVSRGLLWRFW